MFQPENIRFCPVWPCQTYIGFVGGVVGGVIAGLIAAWLLAKKIGAGLQGRQSR